MPQETISRSSLGLHSFERASRLIGDHWTLLIVRELTLNRCLTFTELMVAVRGISTNILSHRLHQLVYQQVLTVDQSSADGRKQFYSLTPLGADLRPVIRSIELWGREYSAASAAHKKISTAKTKRELGARLGSKRQFEES